MSRPRLGIGIIGSGFNAGFHLQAFTAVRDAEVRGVWSPNAGNAAALARRSAEQKQTVRFLPRGLDSFVPAVGRGRWKPVS